MVFKMTIYKKMRVFCNTNKRVPNKKFPFPKNNTKRRHAKKY